MSEWRDGGLISAATYITPFFPKRIRRDVPGLQIVDRVLWDQAHAAKAARRGSLLRRNNQLIGQRESINGKYLLSGHLRCGHCGAPLLALKRGRNNALVYAGRAHRDQGSSVCSNGSGIPAHLIEWGVVESLFATFSTESFTAHLRALAGDDAAKAGRERERTGLLARMPQIAAEEERIADAIATGASFDVLVGKLKALRAERGGAELRLAQIEGDARDMAAETDTVERLRAQWSEWSVLLNAASYDKAHAAPGELLPVVSEASLLVARQVLRKVLVESVAVFYTNAPEHGEQWAYEGVAAYNGVLRGNLSAGMSVVHKKGLPIAGGSDAPVGEVNRVLGLDRAPHTPQPPGDKLLETRLLESSTRFTATRSPASRRLSPRGPAARGAP